MKEKNISWRSFWNGPNGPGGPISTKWNVRGWPTIYVLDNKGVIRYRGVRGEAMDKAVDTLLAEMGVDVESASEKSKEAKASKRKTLKTRASER